jgi:hypothetical protein
MGQTEISRRCYGKNGEWNIVDFACAKSRRIGILHNLSDMRWKPLGGGPASVYTWIGYLWRITAANTAAAAPAPSPNNYAFATSIQVGRGGTIIDSGATSHFCPDRTKFITFEAIKAQDVHMADGTTISALGRGDIKVDLLLGNKYTTVTLKNTLYTPKMALTLISAHRITAAGFTVQFKNNACKIISPAPKRKLIALIAQVNGLYAIPAKTEESAHVAKLTINELHCALGHVAQGAVQYAVKQD